MKPSLLEQTTKRRRAWRLPLVTLCSLGHLWLLLGVSGCGPSVTPPTEKKSKEENLQVEAVERLRKASDPSHFRDALRMLNNHLTKHPDAKSAFKLAKGERELLKNAKDGFGLDAGDLEELESTAFTAMDVQHVEFCFQMNEVARSLPLRGLTVPEQAGVCFDWVVRQVALQEHGGELLPPRYVLQRGYGASRERALVLLALLQQVGIDGCLVASSDAQKKPHFWAVGVLESAKDKKNVVYLFDARLGIALPGPGGEGPATLAQVREHPDVLKPLSADDKHRYDVTPEQARDAEVFVVAPLSALAPRLRYLEALLVDRQWADLVAGGKYEQDRVRLAVEPLRLLDKFTKTQTAPVRVWNRAADPNSPIAALRHFLPVDEGGTDKMQRLAWHQDRLLPWVVALSSFDDLPDQALPALRGMLLDPMHKEYIRLPHDYLVRGRFDEAMTRLVRVYDELHLQDLAEADAAARQKQRAEWRERVRTTYINLARAQNAAPARNGQEAPPELRAAQSQVISLWAEDQNLLWFILGKDEQEQKKFERKLLGQLFLEAVAETVGSEASYLKALCWQEKAAREQVRFDRAKRAKKATDEDPLHSWQNVEDLWRKYVEEYPVVAGTLPRKQLPLIHHLNQAGQLRKALAFLSYLGQQMRAVNTARLLRAEALRHAGQRDAALDVLKELTAELTTLEKEIDDPMTNLLRELRASLNERFDRAKGLEGAARLDALGLLENVSRDLAVWEKNAWRDNLNWLRAGALYRAQQWQKRE
jgi:hypothetical protein